MRGFLIAAAVAAFVSPVSAHADLWTYTGQTIYGLVGFDTNDGLLGTLYETVTYDTVANTESATANWVDPNGTIDFVMSAQSPTNSLNLSSTTATGVLAGLASGADTLELAVTGDITTTPSTISTALPGNGLFLDTSGVLFDFTETVTLAGVDTPATNAPEPASIALLLSGLFGLRLIRQRKI